MIGIIDIKRKKATFPHKGALSADMGRHIVRLKKVLKNRKSAVPYRTGGTVPATVPSPMPEARIGLQQAWRGKTRRAIRGPGSTENAGACP
jgi:hypothetical protein